MTMNYSKGTFSPMPFYATPVNYLSQRFNTAITLLLFTTTLKKRTVQKASCVPQRVAKIHYENCVTDVTYNLDGSIESVSRKENDGTFSGNLSFSYSAGKISDINMGNTKLEYTYDADLVRKVDLVNKAGMLLYSYEFTYDNSGRLKSQTEYIKTSVPGQTTAFSRKVFSYNNRGNISNIVLLDFIENAWQKTGEVAFPLYDNQKNTSVLLENYPYLPVNRLSANNPLKEERRNEYGILMETINYEYIYDSCGRPVVRKAIESLQGDRQKISSAAFSY